MKRLLHYCQNTLGISRRKCTQLIDEGHIFIDGQKIESYIHQVQGGEELHIIANENIKTKEYKKKINLEKHEEIKIILFNKPIGYTVSKHDIHNQTIYDILPEQFTNYYYIGRLDKNSCGLLLLTNSSHLVHQIGHPSKQIEKEYTVHSKYPLTEKNIQQIEEGVQDENEILRVKKVKKIDSNTYRIILIEGKKRHIRRIFIQLNNRIEYLQRIREGIYALGDIKESAFKIIEI